MDEKGPAARANGACQNTQPEEAKKKSSVTHVAQRLVLDLEHLVELVLRDAVAEEDDGLGLLGAVGAVL